MPLGSLPEICSSFEDEPIYPLLNSWGSLEENCLNNRNNFWSGLKENKWSKICSYFCILLHIFIDEIYFENSNNVGKWLSYIKVIFWAKTCPKFRNLFRNIFSSSIIKKYAIETNGVKVTLRRKKSISNFNFNQFWIKSLFFVRYS